MFDFKDIMSTVVSVAGSALLGGESGQQAQKRKEDSQANLLRAAGLVQNERDFLLNKAGSGRPFIEKRPPAPIQPSVAQKQAFSFLNKAFSNNEQAVALVKRKVAATATKGVSAEEVNVSGADPRRKLTKDATHDFYTESLNMNT
jgi:Na+-transporting NADH:ubiquinone oxidoreductase subunit NqrC